MNPKPRGPSPASGQVQDRQRVVFLETIKANVREKRKTLDDIYRFAVEQTAMARGELLELAIVLILVFELVLFFAGIMD